MIPFVLRHEVEQKFRDARATNVKDMTAADVNGRPVNINRATQAARLRIALQDQERIFATIFQASRESQAGDARSQD